MGKVGSWSLDAACRESVAAAVGPVTVVAAGAAAVAGMVQSRASGDIAFDPERPIATWRQHFTFRQLRVEADVEDQRACVTHNHLSLE